MYGKDGRWYQVRHQSVGRQLEVYRYIQMYTKGNGHPPALQEIANEVRVTTSTARSYLRALEKAGLINRSGAGVFTISEMKILDTVAGSADVTV